MYINSKILSLAVAAAVCLATDAFVIVSPSVLSKSPVAIRMSDEYFDQPSDSSSDELVDVEATEVEQTELGGVVTSVLDELPSDISFDVNADTRAKINEALLKLEALTPTEDPTSSPLLNGVWSLKYAGGYSSDWALQSPTRQLALFLYSGGYSPGLFALSLASKLPPAICEVGDLVISISRDQPRIEANIKVKFFGGQENEISVKADLKTISGVRMTEEYASATVLGNDINLPDAARYSRDLYITYVDEDILVVRDASGVPEILVRK
mmetsp:Transcript_15666/g.21456  ORF Transcript_15666/g.21456 Transcript_15666/m.21456 type:complete len:268 (-) Transcript_15666:155-958(-)